MPKYNKRKVDKICRLIASDNYTIAEICAMSGISERCYYDWQANNAEFAELIQKARDKHTETLVKEAKNSLIKLVSGYDVEETKTVFIEGKDIDPETGKPRPKIKERTTTKKHYQPNVAAVIFQLTNKAPDEYKNRLNNELTGKDGKDLFAKLPDEELDARIAELEKKIGKSKS